jgi:uncharacterized membrane protein
METSKEQPNQDEDFLNKTLVSYVEFEEKWADTLARFLTNSFGTLRFLNLTIVFFLVWIIINLGLVPGVAPFDSNSFNWLMVIVQLFSIVLSIVVLISQKREEKINEIYQKMDFEINVRAEHEITKILQMIEKIHREMGIDRPDKELEEMKEKIDIEEVKETVEQVIEEQEKETGVI